MASAAYIRHHIRTALGSIKDHEIRRLMEGKVTVQQLIRKARVHAPAVPWPLIEDAVIDYLIQLVREEVGENRRSCGECGGAARPGRPKRRPQRLRAVLEL